MDSWNLSSRGRNIARTTNPDGIDIPRKVRRRVDLEEYPMLSLNENILISKATVFNPLRDFFFSFFCLVFFSLLENLET